MGIANPTDLVSVSNARNSSAARPGQRITTFDDHHQVHSLAGCALCNLFPTALTEGVNHHAN
jgi:hypothetical protein